jgi:DNA-binding transcriptional LysR family regulator
MHRRHFEKNIPTEVIRSFITIVDLGSFTKAAEHLGVTQPAISAQVKRLERILGGEVFQPGSRLRLTERGELVAMLAQRIVHTNEQIMSLAGPRLAPNFRIGLPNGINDRLLVDIIKKLSAGHPGRSVQFSVGNTAAATRSLRSGFLDFAFAANREGPMPNPVCEWTEELYWAKSPDLVIAPHAPVPLVSSHGSMSNQFAIQALERAQRRYVITFSADDLNLRMAAVLAGVGVIVGSSRAFPQGVELVHDASLPKLDAIMVGIYVREGLDIRRAKSIIKILESIMRPYATRGREPLLSQTAPHKKRRTLGHKEL